MKTAIHSKFNTFLLGLFVFTQSCTVYHSTAVDIEKAVQTQNKVKLVTNTKDTYRFKKIIEKDNMYYGVANPKSNSNLVDLDKEKPEIYYKNLNVYPLELQHLKGIYTKNRELSTVLSIGIPVVLVTVALIIIAQSLDFNIGTDGFVGY